MNEFISKISNLFNKYGIKSITMDDLARELGISKN
jgi:AcrR family transcriptional regulator